MNLYDIDIKFILISKQYRLIVFLYPRWLEFTSENTRRSVIGKSHDKCWSIQNQTIDPLLSYPSNHGGHSGGHTEAFFKNFFWHFLKILKISQNGYHSTIFSTTNLQVTWLGDAGKLRLKYCIRRPQIYIYK